MAGTNEVRRRLRVVRDLGPLVLSATALVVALQSGRGPSGRHIPVLIATPAPALPPAAEPVLLHGELSACSGKGSVVSLHDMMVKRFNAGMTRVAYALYHDDGPIGDRLMGVEQTTENLVRCMAAASDLPTPGAVDDAAAFKKLLAGAQSAMLAVKSSAQQRDEMSTRHWFQHLEQTCATCHARFELTSF
jgi:hypothetical protein